MLQRATAILTLMLLTGPAFAGPLTPPPGPITSTHKTLTEVEPRIPINSTNTPGDADSTFRITAAGSYYLTGNITGAAGRAGIEVAASNVTIDLSGYSMNGVASSLAGIRVIGSLSNLTIRNGSISNWAGAGIDGSTTLGALLEGLHVSECGDGGIRIGRESSVQKCIARMNTSHGIQFGHGSTVTGCAAALNTGNGIWLPSSSQSTGSVIQNCSSTENGGQGFSMAGNVSISHCIAAENVSEGFGVARHSTVLSCTAHTNGGSGFTNAARNGGSSIFGSGNSIIGCTSYENEGYGINMGNLAHLIEKNVVYGNSDGGIFISTGSVVVRNLCRNNGPGASDGTGIRASGSDNRIEENTCCGNDRGIEVIVSGNFIARNTCSGNTTNWVIATGNVCFILSAAPTIVAISGDSGGLSPGSTNPNANYTY